MLHFFVPPLNNYLLFTTLHLPLILNDAYNIQHIFYLTFVICYKNAIGILGYERNQILNFQKQTARILSHNKTVNNKMKKRNSFKNAASKLLEAVGGNVTSPTCTDTTSSRHALTPHTV